MADGIVYPLLNINWMGIIASMVAAFVFGFMWYGPLFGKKWAQYMGLDFNKKPETKAMVQGMLLQVVGLFLTVWVTLHANQVWRPSVWGLDQADPSPFVIGFFGGIFPWLGYKIPVQLGRVSWEGKSWKLFFLNSGYDFLMLQIISQILVQF
jgi:Protein of unknown function (DUF1761)